MEFYEFTDDLKAPAQVREAIDNTIAEQDQDGKIELTSDEYSEWHNDSTEHYVNEIYEALDLDEVDTRDFDWSSTSAYFKQHAEAMLKDALAYGAYDG